jgi:DNA-binding Lrp family transcriptional regulator
MADESQESVDAEDILDSITLKIAKTLFENPKIPYNKTSLAKAADVSKDALFRRWDTLVEGGLVEKAEVESSVDHWQLKTNGASPLPDALSQILYIVGNDEQELNIRTEDDLISENELEEVEGQLEGSALSLFQELVDKALHRDEFYAILNEERVGTDWHRVREALEDVGGYRIIDIRKSEKARELGGEEL